MFLERADTISNSLQESYQKSIWKKPSIMDPEDEKQMQNTIHNAVGDESRSQGSRPNRKHIPMELVVEIAKHLCIKDLLALTGACRAYRAITTDLKFFNNTLEQQRAQWNKKVLPPWDRIREDPITFSESGLNPTSTLPKFYLNPTKLTCYMVSDHLASKLLFALMHLGADLFQIRKLNSETKKLDFEIKKLNFLIHIKKLDHKIKKLDPKIKKLDSEIKKLDSETKELDSGTKKLEPFVVDEYTVFMSKLRLLDFLPQLLILNHPILCVPGLGWALISCFNYENLHRVHPPYDYTVQRLSLGNRSKDTRVDSRLAFSFCVRGVSQKCLWREECENFINLDEQRWDPDLYDNQFKGIKRLILVHYHSTAGGIRKLHASHPDAPLIGQEDAQLLLGLFSAELRDMNGAHRKCTRRLCPRRIALHCGEFWTGMPTPFEHGYGAEHDRAFRAWIAQRVHHMTDPTYLEDGPWFGVSADVDGWVDEELHNISFSVCPANDDGVSGIYVTCKTGIEDELELRGVCARNGSIQLRNEGEVVEWSAVCTMTPFGIIGLWRALDFDGQPNGVYGIVWLYKEAWVQPSQRTGDHTSQSLAFDQMWRENFRMTLGL